MREFKFQAQGSSFQPSGMDLSFLHAFGPGAIATFGGMRGSAASYGAALYLIPTDLPRSQGESDFAAAFKHLALLLPSFRAAGASEFILHFHRQFETQCNEEFTREELALLASLGCHLFYQGRHAHDVQA
jgi:hypothetical protein